MKGRMLVCAGAIGLALCSATAHAETSFDTSTKVDVPIALGGWSAGLALWLARDHSATGSIECETQLCGDAHSDGARPYNRTWDKLSWGTLSLTLGGALVPAASRTLEDNADKAGLSDSGLMLAQAVGVTFAATELAKTLAPRYRPFLAYEPRATGPSRVSPDAEASYFSGHTSFAFAAATLGTFDACRAHSSLGCLGPALTLQALAATTGTMRVLAGKHHISDVLVGAAIGTAAAATVAMTHKPAGREQAEDGARVVAATQPVMLSMLWLW